MKQKNILKTIVLSILFFTTLSASAQLVSYSLTANGTPSGVDANITATSFTSNGVGTLTFGSNGAFANTWTTGGIDLTDYFEITLSPNAGYEINITAINFGERRSKTGIRDYQVRWSVDDFASSTTIATVNVPDNDGERSGNITGLDIDVADGETIKIRWYGYSAEATAGTWRINDGTLNIAGTATPAVVAGTPGITLTSVSGNTNEDGTTATFTAVLNSQPASNVVLNISSANTNEVTVSPASLTFTNGNWDTPQVITLTGVNDLLFDGNQDVIITVSVDDALSADAYDAVADVTRTVTNEDDDVAPSVGFAAATSSENETDVTFTSANIPITVANYLGQQININVSVTGGTAEVGDYTFTSPTALSFTANGTQNITVDINDDADTDNETIIFTITETIAVTGLVISQATHTLTILDNDTLPNFENFNNSNATASYTNNSFVGNNGITWTYVQSRNENGDANSSGINGNALMLRRIADDSKVTSSTITGGIQNFSVKLYKGFTGGGDRQVELFINNVSKGTSVAFDNFTEQTFTVNDINVTGDIIIEIRNTKSTQIIVDDISWTSFSPITATWTGNTNTDWATASNWDTNTVPTSIVNANIPDVTNAPIIGASTNAAVFDLTINEPAGLVINSGGSIIVNGTSTGNVTYTRNLPSDNWYLVSSPVVGQVYNNDYVTANSIASGTENPNNRGIGIYETGSDNWSYLQVNGAGTFNPGQGYSVKRTVAGDISFTGTINTSDVSLSLVTGGRGGINLVGNPYTSYINSATFTSTNNGNLNTRSIWIWNQGIGKYDVKPTDVESYIIAPAQGFFVKGKSANNIVFTKANQTNNADTFQKTSNTVVNLFMTDGSVNRYAKVYFVPNATTGYDNGYDGETFVGIEDPFDVFTNLLTDNEGKKYQVQSLPNSDYENMVVPVGISATAGKEIIFTAEALNLPEGIKVFLEDRLTNTMTRLDEINTDYKVTLTESVNGIGRFYLHTKASSVLSTTDVTLQNVSVYTTDKTTLRVVGLTQGKASLKLYNMLGKQVFATSFNSLGVKDLNLPTLSTGIYVVQLETESGKLNKKITLE